MFETALFAILALGLIIVIAYDVRYHMLPWWVVYPLLVLGLLVWGIQTSWWNSLLIALAIAATNLKVHPVAHFGISLLPVLIIWIVSPETTHMLIYWAFFLLSWELQLIGAADVLIGLALMMLFPGDATLWMVLRGLLIWQVLVMGYRAGKKSLRFNEEIPAMGGYALAVVGLWLF